MKKLTGVALGLATILSGSALTDPQTCGDFNGGGIGATESVEYMRYLYLGGPLSVNYGDADVDDFEIVTVRDALFVVKWLFAGGVLSCPPTMPSLENVAVHSDSIFLHTFESAFPYASILGPGDSTYVIHVMLTTDDTLEAGCFPFSIRIGADIPEIIRAAVSTSCPSPGGCGGGASVDTANAIVATGVLRFNTSAYMMPGTHEVATVEIRVPPLVATWRSVTIALDSMPPVQAGKYAHQPWVTTPSTTPGVYRPEVYSFPCLGTIRGNIDYSADDRIDISDLTYLVKYMFKNGNPPRGFEEVDVNATLTLDIADLTYQVRYMFKEGPEPAPCP